MLRPRENCLEFPVDDPIVDRESPIECLPGTFVGEFDPPRHRTEGGIVLLERGDGRGWANDHRPDACTVLAAGEGVPLSHGDRVMVAPYSAHELHGYAGFSKLGIFGIEDDVEDVTILKWDGEVWAPMFNWCSVLVEPKSKEIVIDERRRLLRAGTVKYHNWGTVLQAGPDAIVEPGERVVLHRDRTTARPEDSKWFRQMWGPYPKNAVFVREASFDHEKGRVERRLLGAIHAKGQATEVQAQS